MISTRGCGRPVKSAHRTWGLGVLVLLASIAGCSSSTSADRDRLRTLQDDPMAAYEPLTGELLSSHEEPGSRYYVFFHGEWDESFSTVSRSWTIETDLASATEDLLNAVDDTGWTLVVELRDKNSTHLVAEKKLSDFCGSAQLNVSDESRHLDVSMGAPNSRSDPRPWEDCLGLDPEDRDNLETLESDPMTSYAPPTGELVRYEWRANRGFGNVEKVWTSVGDQETALAHISDAMEARGWTLIEEIHYEQTIEVKAQKLIEDFCAHAYIVLFTEGTLKLELTPGATLKCETG